MAESIQRATEDVAKLETILKIIETEPQDKLNRIKEAATIADKIGKQLLHLFPLSKDPALFSSFNEFYSRCKRATDELKGYLEPTTKKNKLRKFRMKGYLKKEGANTYSSWQRRFFKREGDKLYYYIDEEELKPQGFIDLTLMTTAQLSSDDPKRFFVGSKDTEKMRVYHLEADVEAVAKSWVLALNTWKAKDKRGSHSGRSAIIMDAEQNQQEQTRKAESEEVADKKERRKRQQELEKFEKQRQEDRLRREEERRKRQQLLTESSAPLVYEQVSAPPNSLPVVVPAQADDTFQKLNPIIKTSSLPPTTLSTSSSSTVSTNSLTALVQLSKIEEKEKEEKSRKEREQRVQHMQAQYSTQVLEINRLKDTLEHTKEKRDQLKQNGSLAKTEDISKMHEVLSSQEREHFLLSESSWAYDQEIHLYQTQYKALELKKKALGNEWRSIVQEIHAFAGSEKDLEDEIMKQELEIEYLKTTLDQIRSKNIEKSTQQVLVDLQHQMNRADEAYEAHNFQQELLKFEKRKQSQQHKEELDLYDIQIQKLISQLQHTKRKLHFVRGQTLEYGDDVFIEEHINRIKKEYFQALVLSIKLSTIQHDTSSKISGMISSLYTTATDQKIPWESWPLWINNQIGKPSSLKPIPDTEKRKSNDMSASNLGTTPSLITNSSVTGGGRKSSFSLENGTPLPSGISSGGSEGGSRMGGESGGEEETVKAAIHKGRKKQKRKVTKIATIIDL